MFNKIFMENHDCTDSHLYISLVSKVGMTTDLKFKTLDEATTFIVALSAAVTPFN